MIYINKNGEIFQEPLVMPNGALCYNPTMEMLAKAGYFPKLNPTPITSGGQIKSVYKFDRYKVILALGDGWITKKAELESAGLYDLFMAAPYLSTGNEIFMQIYNELSPEEKRLLHQTCKYEA